MRRPFVFAKSLRAVSPHSPPKADENRAWDGAAAVRRLREWAGGPDKEDIDWAKYRTGFAWYDPADSKNFGAYKLPHHDVEDGNLVTVWRGVAAAMAALMGSRGGVDIPDSDVDAVYNHLARHYAQFDKEPPERSASDDATGLEAPAVSRGLVETTDAHLALINILAADELAADDVYILESIVSTNALNSYFLRMADSSLANYVEDAKAGNPLMTGHDLDRLPIGCSFDAELADVDGFAAVIVRDYMLKSHNTDGSDTDEIARGIQAGIYRDMSITFGGSDAGYRCSICGLDLFDRECPHVPGMTYGDIQAFAWVDNARMLEHSIVFSGADPGAVIRKARSMAVAGKLSAKDIRYLETSLRARIDYDPACPDTNKGDKMTGRELLAKLRSALTSDMAKLFGIKIDSARAELPEDATIEMALAQVAEACRTVSAEGGEAALAPYKELGINSIDDLKALADKAKFGDTYRNELVETVLAEGIRAHGDTFDKDRWTRLLAGSSIDDLNAFKAQFAVDAEAKLGNPGRQTAPSEGALAGENDFASLSTEEQEKRIGDFLARTAPGGPKKREAN